MITDEDKHSREARTAAAKILEELSRQNHGRIERPGEGPANRPREKGRSAEPTTSIRVRCSIEYRRWLHELARITDVDVADLVGAGLWRIAESVGHRPPPRRIRRGLEDHPTRKRG